MCSTTTRRARRASSSFAFGGIVVVTCRVLIDDRRQRLPGISRDSCCLTSEGIPTATDTSAVATAIPFSYTASSADARVSERAKVPVEEHRRLKGRGLVGGEYVPVEKRL